MGDLYRANKDHWSYFCKRRVTDAVLEALTAMQRDLGVRRARAVGLLDPDDVTSPGRYRREHVVGLAGKVFSSPLRTLERERVDKATGELRPIRRDTPASGTARAGRQPGVGNEVRHRLGPLQDANHRVILGVAHFDATTTGGEGRVFTDLALDLSNHAAGIHAYTDGAWRGTHLNRIRPPPVAVSSPHPAAAPASAAASAWTASATRPQPLPWSRRRLTRDTLPCRDHPDHNWWEPASGRRR